jgi:hypothetical protein
MNTKDIGLNVGKLLYWDMEDLTDRRAPGEQLEHLKEDLAQVEMDSDTLLDIGWYGSGSEATFRVFLIHREDWEEPVFCARVTTWSGLIVAINAALSIWRVMSD